MLALIKSTNPILHTSCEPILEITPEIVLLAKDMIDLMYKENGIGLAAPQIGQNKRIFVMHVSGEEDSETRNSKIIINPSITHHKGKIKTYEGCLSYPGLSIPVRRARNITMTYCNLNGEYIELELEGTNAICAQHEIDHLDGITFIKRLPLNKRKRVLRKYSKKYG